MINSILTRIVGTKNERELKRIRPVVTQVGSFEPALRALDDHALAAKTVEFRERLAKGATLDDLLPRPSRWCARADGACSACATSTSSSSGGWPSTAG